MNELTITPGSDFAKDITIYYKEKKLDSVVVELKIVVDDESVRKLFNVEEDNTEDHEAMRIRPVEANDDPKVPYYMSENFNLGGAR